METISAAITIVALLMFLSSGTGHPNPSVAPIHRPIHLWLHTGPLVSTPKCYSSTVEGPLTMVQLKPCDYLVTGVHEGDIWCEDSWGVHSSNHNSTKKSSLLPEGLATIVGDLLNLTLIALKNVFETEEGFSDGQKQILGEVETGGARVTHCGALNLTGNTMRLRKINITCPAQREKDEYGVERYWPAINFGSTYNYSGNDGCVHAERTCSWSKERGLHLTPSDRIPPCPATNVDITWAVDVLQNISKNENISAADIEDAARAVDQALQVNFKVLSTAREEVSSVVRQLDTLLTRVRLSRGESLKSVGSKVAIFVLNVEKQPPLAVALQSNRNIENLEGSVLRTINSQEEIQSPEVDVAVLLPQSLVSSTSHVAVAIFSDESAFQDPRYKANSRILSLNMVDAPQLQGEQYVDIVFRPRTEKGDKMCAFWDFTLNGGAWSGEGCELMDSVMNTHDVCRCSHLTHFAEIISPGTVDPEHQVVLTIISIIGCSLSLVGLLAIFVTGAVFRKWRAQLGNKILLHLSAAVFINMLVFLITATELLQTGAPCIVLGVMLHYSVLASFCWMLVSALLQLKRLVIVLEYQHIPRLLLKASLFAWGVPLLPIAVLLAVDLDNYTPEGRRFCYPDGLAFYLAVMCPVLIIVTANLLAFGMILHSITKGSGIKGHRRTGSKLVKQRIVTSVLLFFLFGLSWVFGLVAHLSTPFAYLFCITATLQGFVLFVFFVLGKKESRSYWVKSSTERTVTTSTGSTPAERAPLRRSDETAAVQHRQEENL